MFKAVNDDCVPDELARQVRNTVIVCGLPCPPASREHPSYDNNNIPDLETSSRHCPATHSGPGTLIWQYHSQAGYSSCHPTVSIKALKAFD